MIRRMMQRIVMMLLCSAALLISPGVAGAEWLPVEALTASGGCTTNLRSVATDGWGRVHVVWERNEMVMYQSFASGTWSPLEPVAAGTRPEVSVGEDGTVHVVYVRSSEIYYSRRTDAGWQPEERLTDDPSESVLPTVLAVPEGVRIAWSDLRDDYNCHEIYDKAFTEAIWSADQRLTHTAHCSWSPSLALDTRGILHVTWHDKRDDGTFHEIYHKTFDGTSWSADERLTFANDQSEHVSTAADGAGNVHIVWQDLRDGNHEIYYKMWNGTVWSPDVRLTDDPAESERPSIAVDQDDVVHVVWQESRTGNYQVFHRSCTGGTWSADEIVSETTAISEQPSISVDGGNALHVTWMDKTGGDWNVMYRRTVWGGGREWLPQTMLTSSGGCATNLRSVAADSRNWVHVVWDQDGQVYYRFHDGLDWSAPELVGTGVRPEVSIGDGWRVHVVYSRDGEIYYGRRTDSGWMTEARLTYAGGESVLPTILATPGSVRVAWSDVRDNYNCHEIYYKTMSEPGWGADERVTFSPHCSWSPSLARDSRGVLHMFWHDKRDDGSFHEIYHKTFDGEDWSPDERLTYAYNQSEHSCSAADFFGNVHVVWQDKRDGNTQIYYKNWNGSSWSSDLRLTTTGLESERPSVAVDWEGRVHIVWQDNRTGNCEIFYKSGLGGQWTADENLSQDSGQSQMPAIAVDPAGSLHVAWMDMTSGTWNVLYRTSTPTTGVEPGLVVPQVLSLRSMPNPSSGNVAFVFALPRAAQMDLTIYGADGRIVRHIASGPLEPGSHEKAWDGRDEAGVRAPAGVYFARLRAGDAGSTERLVIMK